MVKQGTYIERREWTRHRRPIIRQWSCACSWRQVLLQPFSDGLWAPSVSCPWKCLWSHVEKVKAQLNLLNLINWSPPPKLSLSIHGLNPWVSRFYGSSPPQTGGGILADRTWGGETDHLCHSVLLEASESVKKRQPQPAITESHYAFSCNKILILWTIVNIFKNCPQKPNTIKALFEWFTRTVNHFLRSFPEKCENYRTSIHFSRDRATTLHPTVTMSEFL